MAKNRTTFIKVFLEGAEIEPPLQKKKKLLLLEGSVYDLR
jgi:hypothetical protein